MASTNTPRPFFAWGSALALAIPLTYLVMLLAGGGSGGFAAWNDLGRLLIIIGVCSVSGIVLAFISQFRGERSCLTLISAVAHLLLLGLLITALANA